MSENKLPKHDSVEELAEFFDQTDMGEFDLPEAEFEVDLSRPTISFDVTPELKEKLRSLAEKFHTTEAAIVREWVEEKAALAA